MGFYYSPIALLFIGATLVQLVLAVYVLTHSRTSWSDPATRTLVYVLIAGMLWSGPYAVQLMTPTLSGKLLWFKLEHLGPMFLMPALILHLSTYTGQYSWFTRPRLALFGIEPVITTVMILTNDYHNYLWSNPEMISVGSTLALHRTVGPWWYFRVTYQYLLIAIAFLLLFNAYRSSSGDIRRQIRTLFAAYLFPLVVNILFDTQYLLEIVALPSLADIEFTGAALGVSSLLLSYSLLRYRYLDLGPIGRHVAIEHLHDPYVVVNSTHHIVDTNEAFAELASEQTDLIGRHLLVVVPELEGLLEREQAYMREEICCLRTTVQWFDVHVAELAKTGTSRGQGYVLLFRDITNTKAHQQTLESQTEQLELLNQLIRHDIRNEATLSLALLRKLPDADATTTDAHLDALEHSEQRVIELTETARELTDAIAELSEKRTSIRIAPVLEREVVHASMYAKAATVQIDGEIPNVTVLANELLSAVFRNLLQNALQHNESTQPVVSISAVVHDNELTIDIADNGPGIPDEQKQAVFEEGNTLAGSAGTGYGLSLVRTLVDQYGGTITLKNEPTRACDIDDEQIGTVASVTFPISSEYAGQ